VEALSKIFGPKGVSFYYVLSREPHPGFYGFSQPDSLEERQKYTRFANAELEINIPWIIDNMENELQQKYGRMPNSEFIIDSSGKLLSLSAASRFQGKMSWYTLLACFLDILPCYGRDLSPSTSRTHRALPGALPLL
jgi:hypothetical protein